MRTQIQKIAIANIKTVEINEENVKTALKLLKEAEQEQDQITQIKKLWDINYPIDGLNYYLKKVEWLQDSLMKHDTKMNAYVPAILRRFISMMTHEYEVLYDEIQEEPLPVMKIVSFDDEIRMAEEGGY